jgi:hypothetical protein
MSDTLETAQAVSSAIASARETVGRLTTENAAQAIEIARLRRENFRHRRNGLKRLAADLRKPETLEELAALRLERAAVDRIIEGDSLPGWERPQHWFDADRSGFSDEVSL